MELLAYIDPGAGSLFIQAAIATILVVPFFLRSQIRRGIDALRGRKPAVPAAAASPAADDGTTTQGQA
jgi:hypothetical protein